MAVHNIIIDPGIALFNPETRCLEQQDEEKEVGMEMPDQKLEGETEDNVL